ncbi:uncharacterized protein Dwil_GK16497, isoform B [Drosophila willistoni]|uniref:Uncharacterized protein, isoform B n=1 Tax=Drosophila willistoni TaxID=7260 RepID=A0A0Q9X242_DROWI|nr:uncharacterized protein Dwil_GK16497, isoform B [Drosophila willistoni]
MLTLTRPSPASIESLQQQNASTLNLKFATPLTAMLASSSPTPSTSSPTQSLVVEACDERTRLLSSEDITSTAVNVAAANAVSSDAAAAANASSPSPPTTLPLVHTTTATATTITLHPSLNNNNNNATVQLLSNPRTNSNNNNDMANSSTTAQDNNIDAGDDLSSDLSDKFPRPPTNQKKPKLSKLGNKGVGLKRVSFGSSKGSMVETLVFETPTPLSEHVESTFGFDAAAADATAGQQAQHQQQQQHSSSSSTASHLPLVNNSSSSSYGDYAKVNMDDSGIEVQEESERSIVRVSIYQSSQPQQICPPTEYLLTNFADNLDNSFSSSYNCNIDFTTMSTAAMQPAVGLGAAYDRQQSTDSGWDNPFRPGGDLSREADEIVNMIRGGKPITPTEDRTIGNGSAQHVDDNCNGGPAVGESVTKTNISQNQATAQNGTNSHGNSSKVSGSTAEGGAGVTSSSAKGAESNNGVTSLAQVSKQVVPGPTSASHVVIDEKKNKKKGCCVLQ